MTRASLRVTLAAMVAAVALLVSACSGGSTGASSKPSRANDPCPLSAKLVPACGALWGAATQPPTADGLATLSQAVGRRFDFTYRFHEITDQIPMPAESELVKSGTILHISIDAQDGNDPSNQITWGQVADGRFDSYLKADAMGIAALKTPVFVTFEHEANNPAKDKLGSAADFAAAWRHVHDVFVQAGATNAVWVWVMMGDPAYLQRAGEMWPGNDDVDWISWDVYNQSGCRGGGVSIDKYTSFADDMLPFYSWIKTDGPKFNIDSSKPLMISEAGSVLYPSHPAKTAGWYAEIPQTLQGYPQIKAVGLWDRDGAPGCTYRFGNQPAVLKGVASAGLDQWVSPLASDRVSRSP